MDLVRNNRISTKCHFTCFTKVTPQLLIFDVLSDCLENTFLENQIFGHCILKQNTKDNQQHSLRSH